MIAADLTGVQVWLASTPVDMRKSFDGLAEVVRAFLKADPLSGHLFVFRNRGGHLVKVLWWDRDGLAIYYKRLEVSVPWSTGGGKIRFDPIRSARAIRVPGAVARPGRRGSTRRARAA